MSVDALWSIKAKNELEKHIMSSKLRHINKGEKHSKHRLNFESKVVERDFVKMKASTVVLREYSFYKINEQKSSKEKKSSSAPKETSKQRLGVNHVKRSHTFHQGQSKGYDRLTIHHETPEEVVRPIADMDTKGISGRSYSNVNINVNRNNSAKAQQAVRPRSDGLLAVRRDIKKRSLNLIIEVNSDDSISITSKPDVSNTIIKQATDKECEQHKSEQSAEKAIETPIVSTGEQVPRTATCKSTKSSRGSSIRRVHFIDSEENQKEASPDVKDVRSDQDTKEAKSVCLPSIDKPPLETPSTVNKRDIPPTPSSAKLKPPVSRADSKTRLPSSSLPKKPNIPQSPSPAAKPKTPVSRSDSRTRFPTMSPRPRSGKPALTKAAFSVERGKGPYSPKRASLFYDDTAEDEKLKNYILPQHPSTLVLRNAGSNPKPMSLEKRLALRSRNLVPEDHQESKIFPADCKTAFSFKRFIAKKTDTVLDSWDSNKVRKRKMTRIAHKMKLPDLVQRSKTTSAIFRDYKKYRDENCPPVPEPEHVPAPSPLSRVRARIGMRQPPSRLSIIGTSLP